MTLSNPTDLLSAVFVINDEIIYSFKFNPWPCLLRYFDMIYMDEHVFDSFFLKVRAIVLRKLELHLKVYTKYTRQQGQREKKKAIKSLTYNPTNQ